MEEKRRVVKQICKKLSAIPLFTATDFLFFLQAFFIKKKWVRHKQSVKQNEIKVVDENSYCAFDYSASVKQMFRAAFKVSLFL